MSDKAEEPVDSLSPSPEDSIKEQENEERGDIDNTGDVDDLFGDDEEGEEGYGSDEDEDNGMAPLRGHMEMDDEEAEEQAMYTRKFYGEDAENMTDQEETPHHFKEENVEVVRHIVPYRTVGENGDAKPVIHYAKVPEFLTIDPIPFDPPSFEAKIVERLANFSSREDQLGDRLIDENTIRWRYSRDENQQVYKESNAQIVQWSDGKFSLKLGDEYTDVLVNETDNTFFAVSHDQQELMQCYEGGEITKSLMFIPTSTNSKMHQKLTKAVIRRDQRQVSGPGIYIVNKDPELEKSELEKKQQQIVRERRKRQLKEMESRESPDISGSFEKMSNYKKTNASSVEPDSYNERSRRNEYEQDDFLVDDDEEDELDYDEEEDDDDQPGDENDEEAQEKDEDEEKAERLRKLKNEGADNYRNSEEENTTKRRRVAVIDDEEDDE